MSQTAQILEMKTLGFSQEHIAKHLGLSRELVNNVIIKNTRPSTQKNNVSTKLSSIQKQKKDRPPADPNTNTQFPVLPKESKFPQVLEIKPGVYLLTAEDLVAFVSQFKEPQPPNPLDPYQDYIQKEAFQQQYGLSDSTLLRHQKDGLLKIYRLGNKLYLKKSQIVEALEKGKL